MKSLIRILCLGILACAALVVPIARSQAQSWQPVATIGPANAGVPLLLTDGSVMVHNMDSSTWWKLTPDAFGNYVNGTWTQIASLPAGYGPLYFASAVLPDGRVFVMGGEYNFGVAVWSNQGALYDPVANTWTPLAPPPGWLQIGDAQCVVLPDGRLMLANPFDTRTAILDPATLTWSSGATGKTDRNDEEGWTLLPDGTVLTVDAINNPAAERFLPSLNLWIGAGSTPLSLVNPASQEIGPAVLRPDGTVFATGATGHNAIYTPGLNLTDLGTWTSAPDFPLFAGLQLDIADGPACLLPSGNVLCGASPGVFQAPTHFFEFDGTSLIPVPATPRSVSNPSYVGNMLMLPTGQVLYTDFSSDVQVYTPTGAPNDAWRPTITALPPTLVPGQTYTIQGTQFNGLSQCSAYGDDATNATNYPLVRITNTVTGHVYYCRTFNHSTMGVATGATPTSTNFTVPANLEAGASMVEVAANGIPSFGVLVGATDAPIIQGLAPFSVEANLGDLALTVNGLQFQSGDTVTWTAAGVTTNLVTTFVSAGQLTATVTADLTASVGTAAVKVVRADGTASNSATFSVTTDVPAISSISPASIQASSPGFALTVSGVRFRSGDTVTWTFGGVATPLVTTFTSSSQLTAAVPDSAIANTGTATVTVSRSNGRVSNGMAFNITPDAPIVSSVTPVTVASFGPDFTVTVTGSRLLSSDVVRWSLNGVTTSLATTFVSGTQLTAIVPASAILDTGTASVTVIDHKGQVSNAASVTVTAPLPILNTIDPVAVSAGSPSFTMTLTGSFFVSTSVATWQVAGGNKIPLTTTYVSPTTLTAVVPASFVTAQGRAQVFVNTPGAGPSLNGIQFLITAPLSLSSISPNTVLAATPFTMTLKGANFLSGAMVQVGGTLIPGTLSSSSQMTALIPASAIPLAGTMTVRVVNPGGATSAGLPLTLQNPSPKITSLTPSTVKAGSPTFTLTINGTGLVTTSQAKWNGANIPTTYVSPTQIQATISASLIVKTGSFSITVQNPTPGGGGSNGVNLIVN